MLKQPCLVFLSGRRSGRPAPLRQCRDSRGRGRGATWDGRDCSIRNAGASLLKSESHQEESGRNAPKAAGSSGSMPARDDFFPNATAYLNSAAAHPFSRGARRAVMRYLGARSFQVQAPRFALDAIGERVRVKFGALINARPDEICTVQSTTVGEHLGVASTGYSFQRWPDRNRHAALSGVLLPLSGNGERRDGMSYGYGLATAKASTSPTWRPRSRAERAWWPCRWCRRSTAFNMT